MSKLFNTKQQFGSLNKALHWGVGFGIIIMLVVGTYMTDLQQGSTLKSFLYLSHKSIGVLILPVTCVWFLFWVLGQKPDPIGNTPKPLQRLSKLVHFVLILSVVGMPLSGWVMSSAFSGQGVSIFNLVTLPAIVEHDPAFGRAILGLHILLSWFLIGFGSLHVFAALYHHFIRKNIVLRRMLPLVKPLKTVKKTKKASNVHHLGRK